MIAAVIIPDGHVALGKLAQALIHGAKVVPIRGSFDDALHVVRQLGERGGVTVVNSINPFRIEGQKTAAFEICDALGDAPDVHCIPVGNAGNITAYWKGYGEYARDGLVDEVAADARLAGRGIGAARARRAGAAPRDDRDRDPHRQSGELGRARSRPATSRAAQSARSPTPRSSTRTGCSPRSKGVFVEPASAASVAGLLQARGSRFARARRDCGVHGDRSRAEGPEPGDRRDRARAGGRRERRAGARGARAVSVRRLRDRATQRPR